MDLIFEVVFTLTACKILGCTSYNFQDQRTGNMVVGRKYHLVMPSDRPGTLGYEVAAQSVSENQIKIWRDCGSFIPAVGDICILNYNRYGKIDSFAPLEDAGDLFQDL